MIIYLYLSEVVNIWTWITAMSASFVLFVCAGFLPSLSNGLVESRGTTKQAQVADKTEKRNVTDQNTLEVLGNNKTSFQDCEQTKMLMSQVQLQQSQMQLQQSQIQSLQSQTQLQQSQMQLQQSQIQSLQTESQILKILIQSMKSTQRNSSVNQMESSGSQGTRNYANPASETVYVRWGSRSCPNGTAKVYSGVAGGGHYTASGAAVNTLCLPLHPVHSSHPLPPYYTYLYGSEYQAHDEPQFDDDVLCAVCLAPRTAVVMVPATNTCPTGWTVEYTGYLMAGYHVHAAGTEYICMDMAMEGRYGSKADENGNLFYYVVGQCGSLPCPPYNSQNVLFCVVCAKIHYA